MIFIYQMMIICHLLHILRITIEYSLQLSTISLNIYLIYYHVSAGVTLHLNFQRLKGCKSIFNFNSATETVMWGGFNSCMVFYYRLH